MWKCILHLWLLIPAFVVATDNTIDNCLNSYQISGRRPRVINIQLTQGVAVVNVEMPMARHHIVPNTILRDFFNAVVTRGDNRLHRRLFRYLQRLAGVAHVDIPELQAVDEEQQLRYLQRINTFMYTQFDFSEFTQLPSYARDMQGLFIWMPFNIFEGPSPSLRSDDPGNAFENHTAEIIGTDMRDRLNEMQQSMQRYLTQPTFPYGADALDGLELLLNTRQLPFVFNGNNWLVRHPQAEERNPRAEMRFEIRTPENERERQSHPNRLHDLDAHHPCFGGRHHVSPVAPSSRRLLSVDDGEDRRRKVITFCYVKLTMPSTVNDDPACVQSMNKVVADKNTEFHYHDNKLWDLKDIDLLQTKNLAALVDTFQQSEENSWKEWFRKHPFEHTGNLLFKDNSFAIEFSSPCLGARVKRDDSSTCSAVMIFDSLKRPLARLEQQDKKVYLYKMGKWRLAKQRDWYSKFNAADDIVPGFNFTIRTSLMPSRIQKMYKRESCSTPMQSAGLIGGAVTGGVVGSGFFPGVGTLVGGFLGFTSGAVIGLFSGSIIASSACT